MRLAYVLAPVLIASSASAQAVDRRYAEEPTGGVAIPLTPLAGEHDARAVVVNPGGLSLLRGPELALALDVEDLDVATSGGQGFGAYAATAIGGGIVPRFGLGVGLEWLRPPRTRLAPDPGQPFRSTLATSYALGRTAGIGIAWHHFLGDGTLKALDTFDLGVSARFGNHVAIGATALDINTGAVAGTPVQRRYELETVFRPLATDALEVALGGRIGETRGDADGWGRVGVRVARGVYVAGGIETRALHAIDATPMGEIDHDVRDVRATLGVSLSLGNLGIALSGTGLRDETGGRHPLAGTFVATVSSVPAPSLLPAVDHIERVEISGTIGARELTALVVRMRAMRTDPTVKAVVVVFDGASAGWATMQELRGELLGLEKSGRKVFAYMVSGSGRDYYIASAANKIYIDPAGGMRLVGMTGTTFYFKGAFDQIGVLPQFEKIAEYKSAPEQFTETGPTPIAARMHEELFDSLWQQWLKAVADGRHLGVDEVKQLVDNGPYSAGDLAKDQKLVDAVATPEKIAQLITAELGGAYGVATSPVERPERWQRPGIAVIYVDGDITDGQSKSIPIINENFAGGETLVAAITAARADPRVGAIVLRIDSPGGSALASELISREVFATRGVKPIICSMSDLAASGGYFVAAGCDAIYAEPMTITGSIGIFYGKFDLSSLLKKLGVGVDTFKRGKRADEDSMYRPYTDDERASLMDKLRYMYSRFVGSVAEGRKLTKDAVDAAGRGHVYTGEQALPLHLVDTFGGLGDALEEAKRRMGVAAATRVELFELPNQPPSFFGVIGKLLGVHERTDMSIVELPIVRELVRGIPASVLVEPEAAQARLPYDLQFAD
jgi:protease-4